MQVYVAYKDEVSETAGADVGAGPVEEYVPWLLRDDSRCVLDPAPDK